MLATSVSRRTQEIGVRMALGAQRGDLPANGRAPGHGPGNGGPGDRTGSRSPVDAMAVEHVFQVTRPDPVTFGGVALILITVALLACYIPARRAIRVDPIVALRNE